MKFNPFKPNGLIAPGMFRGRIDEIDLIERSLYQAKFGNPVHFMVQGERGIGKSSLFYVVGITASGDIEALDESRFNFLVVSTDLGGADTQFDIVRSIGRELRSELSKRDELQKVASAFWDWLTNWEVLGVRFHKNSADLDPLDLTDDLVNQLSDLCLKAGQSIDGVLILIDEADRPKEDAHLGEFCKVFTERLARRGCNNIILGLAGLPGLLNRLRSSHESSPRVFTTIQLEPLTFGESRSVVESGIEQANDKNSQQVTIADNALDLLATLSEGYPHFIQQFAYSAFDIDSDNHIDQNDVLRGAFGENGALSQLGDKYFNEMYHLKIASDDYRKVLQAMAQHGDSWVSRKDLISETGLPSTTVNNALAALKTREIIFADETRRNRGFYRLPTRSFGVWINATQNVRSKAEEKGLDVSAEENGTPYEATDVRR